MLVKIHKSYRDIIAVCDSGLLGKKFEQGNMQIEIGSFFEGERATEEEVLELFKQASTEDATFNIVGKQSIDCALKAGIISKKGIRIIQGVPVALTLL